MKGHVRAIGFVAGVIEILTVVDAFTRLSPANRSAA